MANIFQIIGTVLSELPAITTVVKEVSSAFQATSTSTTAQTTTNTTSSKVVAALQGLYNKYFHPTAPLVTDGRWGPKTEAAFADALAKLQPILASFGVK